jgi:hypothetical protein
MESPGSEHPRRDEPTRAIGGMLPTRKNPPMRAGAWPTTVCWRPPSELSASAEGRDLSVIVIGGAISAAGASLEGRRRDSTHDETYELIPEQAGPSRSAT